MSDEYDVIVAGLGAMGSATAYHLARAGKKVLGLDRFEPPHAQGSSHGRTRIIREAYFEHPVYVPLVQRAYQLWSELERESGRQLFRQTGGLMIGPPEGALVSGARRSAEIHGLPHEILDEAELRRRFPIFEPTPDMVAVLEPRAGILFPELAIQTHLELAAKHGAMLRGNEPVIGWEPRDGGASVFTAGRTYIARRLVITAGAWLNRLVPELRLPLTVERQVVFWFTPLRQAQHFKPECCPIHMWETGPGQFYYGFPDLGDGVKLAGHHRGEITDPENLRRETGDDEVEKMRGWSRRFIPAAEGPLNSSTVCMYTNTPDEHFILDVHPAHPQVLIVSPCSGHGFKFSSVIGEVSAMMLGNTAPPFDLSRFKLDRLNPAR